MSDQPPTGTMPSRPREIALWTCCGSRTLTVTINPDELSGEAWRLARCLQTTSRRTRDNGVLVMSRRTEERHAQAEGWDPEHLDRVRRMYGDRWTQRRPIIDWQFEALHIWPDHKEGPHPNPDPEALRLLALGYLQREARRIAAAGGTVMARGDLSVRLLPAGWGEEIVVLPDERAEGWRARILDSLLGNEP